MDIETRTFSIPPDKLRDIMEQCVLMFLRDRFTKQELQSLLGKLLFVSHCVAGSRRFLNRILSTLCKNHTANVILPNDSFQRDLLWFIQFLIPFNGIVTFRCSPVLYHVFVDATLVGMGAVWGKRVYTAGIPWELWGRYSITQYEMYNIVVAAWTWGHLWQDKVVLIS